MTAEQWQRWLGAVAAALGAFLVGVALVAPGDQWILFMVGIVAFVGGLSVVGGTR